MNIFVLDKDIKLCAQYHQDMHVGKMILESAQLLCTAHAIARSPFNTPYKSTHAGHPCAKWAWLSSSNYKWLCQLGKELSKEFTYRFEKKHKSEDVIDWCMEHDLPRPDFGLTKFAQAMPEEYKREKTVDAYRAYYIGSKSQFARRLPNGQQTITLAKWTKRGKPEWFV